MATFKKVVTESADDTIAQSTTGSAATLTSSQNFSISGDVTASAVSFNGSGAVALATSLATGVVDATALAENAVTNVKMADDAVDSAEIADGAVDPVHLAGLGANGTSGQILQSVGDGTFRWATASSGDVTGIDAGTGITISDGNTATPEVAVTAAQTGITSIYNSSLAIGAASGKARMVFDNSSIQFAADPSNLTLVLEDDSNSTTDTLRPKTDRGINLGTSSNKFNDAHFRTSYSTDGIITEAIIGTLKIGTPGSGNNTAITSTAAELNILDGVTADKDEINILDGLTATTDQLNRVDATSSIQTQLDAKAPLASPSFTGNVSIGGDLTVSGATITTSTETLEIADNTLILNSDLASTDAGVDAGFVVERGSSGDNAAFFYDNSDASWKVGTSSTQALPSDGARIALQSVTNELDTTDTSVPVGGFQVAGGVAYVRTA